MADTGLIVAGAAAIAAWLAVWAAKKTGDAAAKSADAARVSAAFMVPRARVLVPEDLLNAADLPESGFGFRVENVSPHEAALTSVKLYYVQDPGATRFTARRYKKRYPQEWKSAPVLSRTRRRQWTTILSPVGHSIGPFSQIDLSCWHTSDPSQHYLIAVELGGISWAACATEPPMTQWQTPFDEVLDLAKTGRRAVLPWEADGVGSP